MTVLVTTPLRNLLVQRETQTNKTGRLQKTISPSRLT